MNKPVCIVTGAGRGIGREVAVQLAACGYQVVGTARTEADLRQTGARVPGFWEMPADISDSSSVNSLVDQVLQKFGRIDALAHCAGMAPFLSVEEMTDRQWHEVIDTNLSSAFYLTRAVWGPMKRQGGGVIVNVSSLSARDPFDRFSAYAAAKAGLSLFSTVAAREGQPHGIRVHVVAPGAVETSMFRALVNEQQWPREKCLQPGEVARMIVLCITGELKHTTGEVIWMRQTLA